MSWSVGVKIAAGFGLSVLVLCVIGVTSYLGAQRLIDAHRWVNRTHEVLEKLDQVLSLMTDAETGQRGYVITGDDAYLVPYETASATLLKNIDELRDLVQEDAAQKAQVDAVETNVKTKLAILKDGIAARRADPGDAGFKAAAQIITMGKGKLEMDQIREIVGEMRANEKNLLEQRSRDAESTAERMRTTVILGVPLGVGVLIIAGFFITRNISRPLREMSAVASRVAAGDLTGKMKSTSRGDEVGVLARTFDMMVESLRSVTREITEGANVLGASATQIVASTAQLASSSAETAASVSETTTTVEEVRQTAQVSNQKAKNVSESSLKAAEISGGGKKNTDETAQGMARIREQMTSIAKSMVRLSEQTQAIGQIIATVDDLAQQSNLLAVNASIEAAKAGEQGRGFAVVAQEVRTLAEQSKGATNQVRTILSDIQKATNAAVMATEQGTKAVEAGVIQSDRAGESIQNLGKRVEEAASSAAQIAASSQQQLVGMDQVAQAMESIKRASTQNVDSARQLEAAARNLSTLGQRLKETVGKYKLSNGQAA
jgi:methyl-accepting chemotaxis protein